MIAFPNAKINIGLNITEKRSDGYHNLESCFYPIGWSDILEIIPSDNLTFSSTGIPIPGNAESNLCLKAYKLLQKDFSIQAVSIHLHKVIPIGAGLGGGSSDGAFTLKLLNALFNLSLTSEELETYASKLGGDCPFFIQSRPQYVTRSGNIFQNIKINLSGKYLVVIKPNIHISTAEAYLGIKPHHPTSNILDIIENHPVTTWGSTISNDFEESIFPNHQEINEIKEMLNDNGALYTSMTGSGASVFGIFENPTSIKSQGSILWEGIL